jgi:hypothetical protein
LLACLLACLLALTAITAYSQIVEDCTSNPIKAENCLQGTDEWQIPMAAGLHPFYKPSTPNHELEGYANKSSVNAGEQIRFHLSSRIHYQAVRIKIYRLGYYGGLGGRLIYTTIIQGVQPLPPPIPNLTQGTGEGVAECNWLSQSGAFWDVPANAVSGIYLAQLTGLATGHQSYISFAVRRDDLNSDILFQQSVTVYQAYNNYPGLVVSSNSEDSANGKSLYPPPNSLGPRFPDVERGDPHQARKVSFNRPYTLSSAFGIYDSAGLGFFNYEYPLIRWLEKKGYYVTYATDVDTHANASIIASGKHKALLSNGHDEYWSWEMRDNVEKARDRPNNATSKPLNLGFFGANISYWHIRLDNSSSTGTQPANAPYRTITSYKEYARNLEFGDPYFYTQNHPLRYKTTALWRLSQEISQGANPAQPFYKPEDEMLGIMTIPQEGDSEHPVVTYSPTFCCSSNKFEVAQNAPMWFTAGMNDEKMPNLIGYESDEHYPNHIYPNRTLTIVGDSPFVDFRPVPPQNCSCGISKTCICQLTLLGNAESTFYKVDSNDAKVFSASGMQWAWGLDDWGADPGVGIPVTRPASRRFNVEKITENIMNCLINVSGC